MKTELKISFPNQSEAFAYGVEYGRLLQKMEQGDQCISNNGFPVRIENRELLEKTCKEYGYVPTFGVEHYEEWVEFLGIKKIGSNN